MTVAEKVLENRVRRWAEYLGYRIRKSRAKMLHADDYGKYMALDIGRHHLVLGGTL
jgi:hypothetical protein